MKKLLTNTCLASSLLFGGYSAKADWDYWAVSNETNNMREIYTCNSETGECTLRDTQNLFGSPKEEFSYSSGDKLYLSTLNLMSIYDLSENSWTISNDNWAADFAQIYERETG